MKKILLSIHLLLFALTACEKDETIMTLHADGIPPSIASSANELSLEVTEEILADEVEIRWNKTDYGVDTEVNYTVEVDVACSDFSHPVVIGSTTGTTLRLSVEQLNARLLNDLKLAQHLSEELQVRVRSSVRNQYQQTSSPVTFTVKPWKAWPKGLWLLKEDGNAIGAIYEGTEHQFDGYAYIQNSDAFNFASSRTCAGTILGGSNNTLETGSGERIEVGSAGYYRVKANTWDMTYEITPISTFGVIGTATPGGWGSSTALSFDAASQTWEASLDLAPGALKFRANDDWAINYGPSNSENLEGSLILDDPGAITIQEAGNYTVVLDLSRTKSPSLAYSVRKNSNEGPPAMLWVPGEYQGWSPSTAPTIKAINSSSFEGFVYISAPTGYKFTSAPDWDHINYGDAGTPGTLTTDGLANGMGLATPGYYKFNVNTSALTYSAVLINSIGMIGTATPGSWDSSSPMTYSIAEDTWSATIDLVPGALKFRANNEWTINYGPADSNSPEGTLIFDDPGAINITEAGSYTVTVDFSRNESPYKYTYKVVKN